MTIAAWFDELSALATTAGVVVAIIALFVAIWYTRETKKIREATQTQLGLAQSELKRGLREQRRATQPVLVWRDGARTGDILTKRFENRGGHVLDCYINCPEARESSVLGGDFVGTNEGASVRFVFDRLPDIFEFEFCYTTTAGEIASQRFAIDTAGAMAVRKVRDAERIG